MGSIPQYVKRGATGRIKHPVPVFKAKVQRAGVRKVFAVTIHVGLIVFFTAISTALYAYISHLIRGGV